VNVSEWETELLFEAQKGDTLITILYLYKHIVHTDHNVINYEPVINHIILKRQKCGNLKREHLSFLHS
jgi:hypothetical protein